MTNMVRIVIGIEERRCRIEWCIGRVRVVCWW
jgi:hypothetical protein